MTRTSHRPHRGKGLLALLAATAALAGGAQALAPAPAAAMIDQSISQAKCELLFGEWRWEGLDEFCVLNFGGDGGSGPSYGGVNGGGGGSAAEPGRNDAGGKPAKSEAYRQAEQQGREAQQRERELKELDESLFNIWTDQRHNPGWEERTQCRELREEIRDWQDDLVDDATLEKFTWYGHLNQPRVMRKIEYRERKWKRLQCDSWLPYRGW